MADDYASHYPILAAAVAAAPATTCILELGCGEGSTPLLHYLCKMTGRNLITLDSDPEWLKRYADYRSFNHILGHVADWSKWEEEIHGSWFDTIFVDNAPGDSRIQLIERLRTHRFVAHDSERDWGTGANYGYETIKPLFKYVSEFQRFRPYTLILSNHAPFDIEECDRVWTPPPHLLEEFKNKGIHK